MLSSFTPLYLHKQTTFLNRAAIVLGTSAMSVRFNQSRNEGYLMAQGALQQHTFTSELDMVQFELKPLFKFLRVVNRWLKSCGYEDFSAPLLGGSESVFFYARKGRKLEMGIAGNSSDGGSVVQPTWLFSEDLVNLEVLKKLKTLQYGDLMEALMCLSDQSEVNYEVLIQKATFWRCTYIL